MEFFHRISGEAVVRRLIRRTVRTRRLLGIKVDSIGNLEGALLPILAKAVINLSTNIDPDVETKTSHILEELKREKLCCVDALSIAWIDKTVPCISGKDAFVLYDTYGFPVEITKEVADERGVGIDMDGFDIEMKKQRHQSQAAHNTVKLSVENGAGLMENIPETEFVSVRV